MEEDWELEDALMNKYAEMHRRDRIGPAGMEKLVDALDLQERDEQTLCLAWTLNIAKQGYITRDEWRRGLRASKVTTLPQLRAAVQSAYSQAKHDKETFRSLYDFAFRFSLQKSRQKTLDIPTICRLLELLLHGRSHSQSLIQFLGAQKEYHVLDLDQWRGILRFCDTVPPDFSNYDYSLSWPSILDSYVSWRITKP